MPEDEPTAGIFPTELKDGRTIVLHARKLTKMRNLESFISPDFFIDNQPMSLVLERDEGSWDMDVYCKIVTDSLHWRCDVKFTVSRHPQEYENKTISDMHTFTFNKKYKCFNFNPFDSWEDELNEDMRNDRESDDTFEIVIEVTKACGIPTPLPVCDFTAPVPGITDAILIIEERLVHVSKPYLAIHSSFFHALFFSNFKEKEQKEFELPDIIIDEFTEFLEVIYPSRKPVSEKNIEWLLRLGDRFNAKMVLYECEEFLNSERSKEVPLEKKLLWADSYALASAQHCCVKQLKTLNKMRALKATKEYGCFSHKMKDALIERILEIG